MDIPSITQFAMECIEQAQITPLTVAIGTGALLGAMDTKVSSIAKAAELGATIGTFSEMFAAAAGISKLTGALLTTATNMGTAIGASIVKIILAVEMKIFGYGDTRKKAVKTLAYPALAIWAIRGAKKPLEISIPLIEKIIIAAQTLKIGEAQTRMLVTTAIGSMHGTLEMGVYVITTLALTQIFFSSVKEIAITMQRRGLDLAKWPFSKQDAIKNIFVKSEVQTISNFLRGFLTIV